MIPPGGDSLAPEGPARGRGLRVPRNILRPPPAWFWFPIWSALVYTAVWHLQKQLHAKIRHDGVTTAGLILGYTLATAALCLPWAPFLLGLLRRWWLLARVRDFAGQQDGRGNSSICLHDLTLLPRGVARYQRYWIPVRAAPILIFCLAVGISFFTGLMIVAELLYLRTHAFFNLGVLEAMLGAVVFIYQWRALGVGTRPRMAWLQLLPAACLYVLGNVFLFVGILH